MTGEQLRRKRQAAGLSGYLVSRKSGVGRSRFSEIEHGHVDARRDEVERIERAIRELGEARQKLAQVAVEVGWPAVV